MVTLKDILEARDVLKNIISKTGLVYNKTFSDVIGASVYLKMENLQKTGSFKLRGAYNKIAHLDDSEKRKGVIASSAGNHAQGVAFAARNFSISSTIVMPKHAPISKVAATESYGANVILYGEIYDEAAQKAEEIRSQTGAVFIHPFDDPMVIAGQGTIGLEILEDLYDTDVIVVPIGGGGLVSGIAIAAKSIKPDVKIIGVQAKNAPSMYESFKSGSITKTACITSIADGIAVKAPGQLTFEIIKSYVDDIVIVDEDQIAEAILTLLEKAKVVAEGAGAVSIAALLNGLIDVRNKNVVSIISGGNIDVNILSQVMDKGLVRQGRKMFVGTVIQDRPGTLYTLLHLIADNGANVLSVMHNRLTNEAPVGYAKIELILETKNKEHCQRLIEILKTEGYKVY
ncbi:threonine dehydratase [Caldanaerobius fijiensis DSM 17918]|uniref:L-threonine dehydratase catabolic TdcB n=1 Tax=Caldanaerobius fijiensis DSM 17918 TaxID=1121256 RepID=A0A1M4ZPI9_9THEO|nr:threonine ammonia-lyase [Caldanaerobius fijiensis]SHF19845.1 threonine dehydratase [Caldanaerobius fijiensis DSM 17918]